MIRKKGTTGPTRIPAVGLGSIPGRPHRDRIGGDGSGTKCTDLSPPVWAGAVNPWPYWLEVFSVLSLVGFSCICGFGAIGWVLPSSATVATMQFTSAAFDTELAHSDAAPESAAGQGLAGELSSAGAFAMGSSGTAYQLGVASGVPESVAHGYLTELGLDEETMPQRLLDYDPEDLLAARRSFMHGDGTTPSPLHRSQVTAWMRVLAQAVGPPPPSLFDPNFREQRAAQRSALTAPSRAGAAEYVQSHARAGQSALLDLAAESMSPPDGRMTLPGFGPPPPLMIASGKAGAAVPPSTLAAFAPAARRMGDVLGHGDPGLFAAFTPDELQAAWLRHEQLTGVRPRPEREPSADQLGALRSRLAAGEAPGVDFSIWGPFDRRHARDRRTLAQVWVDGALQPRALAGPSSFDVWESAWAVFSTAMLCLGAAAPGPLGRYRDGLHDLTRVYPDAWGIVSRADEAMRFEEWPRMAAANPEQVADSDWSSILVASSWGESGTRQAWWDRHVIHPAAGGGLQLVNALEGYSPRGASLAAAPPAPRGQQQHQQPPVRTDQPLSKRQRKAAAAERAAGAVRALPPPAPPAPRADAAGQDGRQPGYCNGYNVGRCSAAVCPKGYVHACIVCHGTHAAVDQPGCAGRVDGVGRLIRGKGKGRGRH